MTENDTAPAALPVPLAAPRPSLARSVPNAVFVSQLLASRDRLATQRRPALSPAGAALGAYRKAAGMDQRRMPAGYRKTVVI